MKITSKYYCEKCNLEFLSEYSCQEHEKECGILHEHICDKCGKVTKYSKDEHHDEWYLQNECWTFHPNHYRAGYGSKLDGSEFVLHICDDCLYEFVTSCVHERRIRDSGSARWHDDWEEEACEDKIINVKIHKCSNAEWWYADKIGETYSVHDEQMMSGSNNLVYYLENAEDGGTTLLVDDVEVIE